MSATPHRVRWLRPALAILVLLAFGVPISAVAQNDTASGGSGTAITTSDLNFRTGPSTEDPIIAVVTEGGTLELTGERANGFLAGNYDGWYGWASAEFLTTGSAPATEPTPSEPSAADTAAVTSELNLRTGPSTGDAVVAVMPTGATVSLLGQSANGFLAVSYNGVEGWAYAEFLDTSGEPLPEEPAGPGIGSAVATSSLNLRSEPSLAATVLLVIPAGAAVSIDGDGQNGFLPITYAGQSGWAAAEFLGDSVDGAPAPAPDPVGGSGIVWPVSGGTWEVIQGYNGGTHQNRSASAQYYYALDIARVDGDTAGQPVYAPASGTIQWLDGGSGGIAIDMGNGYIIAMFHSTYEGSLNPGHWVEQGQYLGTISGPGGAGYASTPHVDMTLWQSDGGWSRAGSPFEGANAISGMSFPDVGGGNQHGGAIFNP